MKKWQKRKERKRIVFDSAFTTDIENICANDPSDGSAPWDFEITGHPWYSVLKHSPDEESQALDILFVAVGRAWLAAKK